MVFCSKKCEETSFPGAIWADQMWTNWHFIFSAPRWSLLGAGRPLGQWLLICSILGSESRYLVSDLNFSRGTDRDLFFLAVGSGCFFVANLVFIGSQWCRSGLNSKRIQTRLWYSSNLFQSPDPDTTKFWHLKYKWQSCFVHQSCCRIAVKDSLFVFSRTLSNNCTHGILTSFSI